MKQRWLEPATPPDLRSRLTSAMQWTVDALGLRAPLRRLRRLPERMLHPLRRRRAMEALRRAPTPSAVIFVCHGNIYRSPYAAHLFAAMLPDALRDHVHVSSGGFVGPDRPSPENALRLAAERGYDMSRHRSSLLSPEWVRGEMLAVVMDASQQRTICRRYRRRPESVLILGDLDPEAIEMRTIRDPWGQTDEVLTSSYDRIERCVEVLVKVLFQSQPFMPR